jgi:hypothetical protein
MTTTRLTFLFAGMLSLAACSGDPKDSGATESDADADADVDADADADTDADAEADADADTRPWSSWTSYTVDYTLSFDFDDAYEDILASYGLADCSVRYTGGGLAEEPPAETERRTFEGMWQVAEHDCGGGLEGTAWTDDTGRAWATFGFQDNDGTVVLDHWIAHRDRGSDTPVSEPSAHGQWYITDMGAPVEAGQATWVYDETTLLEGLIRLDISHDLQVGFTE